ncbi:cellulose synthase subunit BcsC-related outer membrane protein [Novosphingobium colocasiae]
MLAELQGEITQLSRDSAPRVDVDTSYRQRSGETGLSQLDEIKGSAKFSTGFLGGRIYVGGEAVMIDAGTPSDSARARFGTNASPEARAIVAKTDARKCDAESDPAACLAQVDSQNASGVALSAGYAGDLVQAEAGTTPIGMGKTKLTFRAAVTPQVRRRRRGQGVRREEAGDRQRTVLRRHARSRHRRALGPGHAHRRRRRAVLRSRRQRRLR